MRKIGEFLAIGVPGLSEGRPSVLVGDRVLATSPNEYASEPTHEGFVHEVNLLIRIILICHMF